MKNKTTYNAKRLAKLITSEIAAESRARKLRQSIDRELMSVPSRDLMKADAKLSVAIDSYFYGGRTNAARLRLAAALEDCIVANEKNRTACLR
jgi:hypothetical protein